MLNHAGLTRRRLLTGSAAVGVGLGLSGCGVDPPVVPNDPSPSAFPTDNPFGLADDAQIEAVVFAGGYGLDYVNRATDMLTTRRPRTRITVTRTTDVDQDLRQRFIAGNPPDLVDNSGGDAIAVSSVLPQLEDLSTVLEAENLVGDRIGDTLVAGALDPGTFDGKLVAINYALTVYGLWYSASLFAAHGWAPPRTWDEAMILGARARAQGRYLFGWGRETATYYLELAIASAVKDAGPEVAAALDSLEARCWSAPAVQRAFTAIERLVDAGYVKPGGATTTYLAAQAQWCNAGEFVLYPAGSWIGNEMADRTRSGFNLTVAPVPTATGTPALPYEAVHRQATEAFVVPSRGRTVAGGKEILRTMLSPELATAFSRSRLALTIVKDTVPADGFGSSSLLSQQRVLAAAGEHTFGWGFVTTYALNADHLGPWNSFLEGRIGTTTLTTRLQEVTDRVREDPTVRKIRSR